jgi:hypothetical protein
MKSAREKGMSQVDGGKFMKRYLVLFLALLLVPCTGHAATLVSGSFESGMSPFGGPYYGSDASPISDSTAPNGTHSLQFKIPYDMLGNSPDIIDYNWAAQDEIWVQFYLKFSSNYAWPSIHDKLVFLPIGSNNFYIGLIWGSQLGIASQITWGPGSQNWTQSSGPFPTRGGWQKVVFHGVANTPGQSNGVGQLWLNDTLIINVSNIPYRNVGESGFSRIMLENVFGGPAGARSGFPMYTYYDSVIVQTTPITGGAVPPPPAPAPAPAPAPKIPTAPSPITVK